MKIWYNNVIDTQRHVVEVKENHIRIGRASHNEIVLDSPYIADEAAVLHKRGRAWELLVLGINGVKVGDRQLYNGERCEIRTSQSIGLFPYSLTLDLPREEEASREAPRAALDQDMSRLIRDIHLELLERMDLKVDGSRIAHDHPRQQRQGRRAASGSSGANGGRPTSRIDPPADCFGR